MTTLGGAFAEWALTTDLVDALRARDLRVVTLWSFGTWAETTNGAVADAMEAVAASRQRVPFTLRTPRGLAHTFDLTVVDLGYSVNRARRFELAPGPHDEPAFRALFRTEVVPSALTHRFVSDAGGETSPFRWCFAGHAGPIAIFDSGGDFFLALDPTGIFGRFADAYGTGVVDVLLGDEPLMCVAAFLSPKAGLVRVSARTSEVGRPIRFAELSRWIASQRDVGLDLAGWRRAIERAFPRSL